MIDLDLNIISSKRLAQIIKDSNKGIRFCFILGSGASVESGIPSGNTLEMDWMREITADPDWLEDLKHTASELHDKGEIQHSFEQIKTAWDEVKDTDRTLSSEYYFDLFKLRFHPMMKNGYRFFEDLMEGKEPSIGYHSLARFLTEGYGNLVITTNFDSLVEDSLFLYTDKRPLVIGHEALAGYIDADVQRPIVAKVHRGLGYGPLNSPEDTDRIQEEWQNCLNLAFSTYTPIVIGYAGGDRSLMTFMEDRATQMRNGIYWCYFDQYGMPDERILNLVKEKKGCLVKTKGFDDVMLTIGGKLFKEDITPSGTQSCLEQQYKKRVQTYTQQYEKVNKDKSLTAAPHPIEEAQQKTEAARKKKHELTPWDYLPRANRAAAEGRHSEAIDEFTNALKLDPKYAYAYYNRGNSYYELTEYDKAIADYTEAIALDPKDAAVYNNRGNLYNNLKEYNKAIVDLTKAITLDPKIAMAYYNRGISYAALKEYDKAIADYTEAIALDPKDAKVYNNRGISYAALKEYDKAIADLTEAIALDPKAAKAYYNRGVSYYTLKEYDKAIADYTEAIALDPKYADAYNNRGNLYDDLKEYDKAIADYTEAIALDPKDADAYYNRGISYAALKEYDKAIADYTEAIALDPKYAVAYNNRGISYADLKEYDKAIADYTAAIALDPMYKKAYKNRAITYRNMGQIALAKRDEKTASKL